MPIVIENLDVQIVPPEGGQGQSEQPQGGAPSDALSKLSEMYAERDRKARLQTE